jgi:protein SCO1/2
MSRFLWIALMTLGVSLPVWGVEPTPVVLTKVSAANAQGTALPIELPIRNPNGEFQSLKSFGLQNRPWVLTFNYMSCPMLCGLQQNGLAAALLETGLVSGKDFSSISVSIDPNESFELAQAASEKLTHASGGAWSVLTAPPNTIDGLTRSAGFEYSYDEESGQFGHSAVTYVLTADGTISQIISGVRPSAQTLRLALTEAGRGEIGSALDQIVLTCLQYDSASSTYAPVASGLMRAGGIGIVGSLGLFLGLMWRRERQNSTGGSDV